MIMKISLNTNILGWGIAILNTCAPQMSYNTGEREEYWAKWGTLKQISDKDCLLWDTDNNGQAER